MPIKYVDGKIVHLPYTKKKKRKRKSPSKALRKRKRKKKSGASMYSEWKKKTKQKG